MTAAAAKPAEHTLRDYEIHVFSPALEMTLFSMRYCGFENAEAAAAAFVKNNPDHKAENVKALLVGFAI